MAVLFLVSTPIGNLGDLSYRAVATLRDVDVVLAEDTRRTGTLLRHYDISARLVSAHEHNERSRAATVVDMLREGKSVALVTDAGTPLLSDPGALIVRAAVEAGFDAVPIPGASALLAALVTAGIPAERFTFWGFLPRKGGSRTELLDQIAALPHASVVYESPFRIADLLRDLAAAAGPDRRVAVARELTKLHEEVFRGSVAEALQRFGAADVKGEIVVVIEGRPDSAAVRDAETDALAAQALAAALLEQGIAPSAVAKELRRRLGIARNEAYQIAQNSAE